MYNITKTDIFKGCLIASISHAIMVNIYPELSYEQSWDGANYSIQNASGMRGTITFDNDFCVGAIRDEKSNFAVFGDAIQEQMKSFPLNIVHKAYEEAFQYLLVERNGTATPCVTSVFWANHTALYYEEEIADHIKNDFTLFENIILPKEKAVEKWKEYYGMETKVVQLINVLFQMKANDFFSTIELSKKHKELIPGAGINNECAEALKELNIIL